MTQTHLFPEDKVWKNRAFSFLVRSRQDLWGKHNEDILAWIFKTGFSNQFVRDMLFGWNKYPKIRPAANWGMTEDMEDDLILDGKLTLPPGLVIPYMVDKDLRKLIFYDAQSKGSRHCFPLPGGSTEPMILGKNSERIAVVFNIIHGLLVHQDMEDTITVVIPHSPDTPDNLTVSALDRSRHCLVFPDTGAGQTQTWPGHIDPTLCRSCPSPSEIIQQIRNMT